MALDLFGCPECKVMLLRSPHLADGSLFQCPRCSHRFPIPPAVSKPTSQQTAAPTEPPAPEVTESRMALDLFGCPECKVMLRRSPHLADGSLFQCPRCSHRFPLPPAVSKPTSQ